jgi:hypothetical protein
MTRRDEAWARLVRAAKGYEVHRGSDEARELSDAAKAWAMADTTGTRAASGERAAVAGDGPTVRFGRDKGKRLSEVADLTWYRRAIAENVDDPARAEYRANNEAHLAAIDAEIARKDGRHE